ncbi:MAG: hypothetical protein EZS28_015142, partial [Streblomastix strix]
RDVSRGMYDSVSLRNFIICKSYPSCQNQKGASKLYHSIPDQFIRNGSKDKTHNLIDPCCRTDLCEYCYEADMIFLKMQKQHIIFDLYDLEDETEYVEIQNFKQYLSFELDEGKIVGEPITIGPENMKQQIIINVQKREVNPNPKRSTVPISGADV